MRRLIPRFTDTRLQSRGDAFTTLARSIVGQQISVKAAQSVWDRLAATVQPEGGPMLPARVLAFEVPDLRGAGLSLRKAEYVRDLAHHFHDGLVHPDRWNAMDDESVITELADIRHIVP